MAVPFKTAVAWQQRKGAMSDLKLIPTKLVDKYKHLSSCPPKKVLTPLSKPVKSMAVYDERIGKSLLYGDTLL